MDLPQLKVWCSGLLLFKVKTNAGYGEDKYVIARDFNDAAEKVKAHYIKEDEKTNTNRTDNINLTPTVKGKEIKVKEVEIISEFVIL